MIYILFLLSFLALNMAHPVTPTLINTLGLPSYMFGIFFAMMAIGNFIFSPIWGGLSDKRGRVKFLIIGLLGYGISQLGFGFIENPFIIIVFRFLGGVFAVSFLTVSIAYITDISNKENRLRKMAYYSATSTFGGALGSLLGGFVGNTNYKLAFLLQFIITAILVVLFKIFIKETLEDTKEKVDFKQIKNTFLIKNIKISKEIVFLIILVILFYFSSTSYNSTINFYLETVLNMGPTYIGTFLAIAGIVGFICNLFITPLLGKKWSGEFISKVCFVTMALSMLGIALSNSVVMLFTFALVYAGIASIYIPVQQSLLSMRGKNNQGSIMGLNNSAKAVGMITGSLFSGFVFDIGNKIPFILSSILLIIGFILAQFKKIK